MDVHPRAFPSMTARTPAKRSAVTRISSRYTRTQQIPVQVTCPTQLPRPSLIQLREEPDKRGAHIGVAIYLDSECARVSVEQIPGRIGD